MTTNSAKKNKKTHLSSHSKVLPIIPSVRLLATKVLQDVHGKKKSLAVILPDYLPQAAQSQQGLLQEICYGSIRWFYRLEVILKELMKKPLRNKDQDIFYLLIIGLYQLEYMHKPDYACVTETVKTLQELQKTWAKAFVNGVLRNYLRQKDQLASQVDQNIAYKYSHPQWLIDMLLLKRRFNLNSEKSLTMLESVLANNNYYPPLWLRINQSQFLQPESYLQQLQHQGIEYDYLPEHPFAVALKQAINVKDIPGFNEGAVSVQDGSPQFAASLLDCQSGDRILDVCAAPGGKTAHILEKYPELQQLLALDNKTHRLEKVKENLQRLNLQAQLKHADALDVSSWWDGQLFDRVLLDVPCSATGVIRRNPDIKLLRTATDIEALAKQQAEFLNKMWALVKPGGFLLYATCSILAIENEQQIATFLTTHTDGSEVKFSLPWGQAVEFGWQILPGDGNMDGFYYAKLQKRTVS